MDLDTKLIITVFFLVILIIGMLGFALVLVIKSYSNKVQNKSIAKMLTKMSQAQAEMEGVDKMKTNFINSITHEIRTPLNAINGFADIIANHPDMITEEERIEYVKAMRSSTDQLTGLINDLVNLSSINNEAMSVKWADTNVNQLLKEAKSKAKPKNGVAVAVASDVPDSLEIMTDRDIVLQILASLLDNACKFTNFGRIEISCEYAFHGQSVRIAVTDTGSGVPKHMEKSLFKKFTKGNEFDQGNGLGLYVSRKLARLIGGSLSHDPSYVTGARFFLVIPINSASDDN